MALAYILLCFDFLEVKLHTFRRRGGGGGGKLHSFMGGGGGEDWTEGGGVRGGDGNGH